MDSRTKFLIYCLEMYKKTEDLTGREVLEVFKRHGLFDHVREFYEILHIHGWSYIREDLQNRIAEQREVSA